MNNIKLQIWILTTSCSSKKKAFLVFQQLFTFSKLYCSIVKLVWCFTVSNAAA